MPKNTSMAALAIASLCFAPAHALTSGPLDHVTGLQWTIASTLDEGESQDFRIATTSDFKTLLSDAGFSLQPQFAHFAFNAGGYSNNMPQKGYVGDSAVSALDADYRSYPQGLPLGFPKNSGTLGPVSNYAMAYLDGSGDSVGVIARWFSASYYGSTSTLSDSMQATWGDGSLIGATQAQITEGTWPHNQTPNLIDTSKIGLFMVKAALVPQAPVPEATSGRTFSLGLIGLVCVAWARRRKQT